MQQSTPAAEYIEDDSPPERLPSDRHPQDVDANRDTLSQELALVADRHTSDMTKPEIACMLYDFADSYAVVHDIGLRMEYVEKPDGSQAALIHFTDRQAEGVAPSPIGRLGVDELREMNHKVETPEGSQ